MGRKNTKSQFIPVPAHKKTPTIDDLLNEIFEGEDNKNSKLQEFFKSYYGYLQRSREDKLEEIIDSISSVADVAVSEKYSRVFSLKYGDPLSVFGSMSGPGGRFNIGNGMGHTKPFPCLYVANDFYTGFCEKFKYPPEYMRAEIDAGKMGLENVNNFSCVELDLNIEKCFDLRNKENLRNFTSIISEIKPTQEFKRWAQELGYLNLRTIQTHGELYNSFLDPEFLKTYYTMDMPSNSQWFGYYCLMAGVQGIIYPSVRDSYGHNIAILTESFRETDSFVKINQESAMIPEDRMILNGDNYEFFKIKAPLKKILN